MSALDDLDELDSIIDAIDDGPTPAPAAPQAADDGDDADLDSILHELDTPTASAAAQPKLPPVTSKPKIPGA